MTSYNEADGGSDKEEKIFSMLEKMGKSTGVSYFGNLKAPRR